MRKLLKWLINVVTSLACLAAVIMSIVLGVIVCDKFGAIGGAIVLAVLLTIVLETLNFISNK